MVKFRGIELCIISQFDISRLPEFIHPPLSASRNSNPFHSSDEETLIPPTSPRYPIVSCYVPIYAGSHIWFEYTVDGPHPPGAAYFFKLFVNDREVTSWDCTSEHGFHGKMMYNLVNEGSDPTSGNPIIRRQALKFGDELAYQEQAGFEDDCIQINVHRVEHRQRIKEFDQDLGQVAINSRRPDGLRFMNSGLLEGNPRPRRYKYQLLDPKDSPYAAFRFFCRPYEELENNGGTPLRPCLSSSSSSNSMSTSSTQESTTMNFGIPGTVPVDGPLQMPATRLESLTTSPPNHASGQANRSPLSVPMSDSDDSLSVRTKDSVEELASNVSRSPRSPKSKSPRERNEEKAGPPPSPTKSPTTRHQLRKKLTLNIGGAHFDLDAKKRPLSPFTNGGLLRRASLPQTAPATVTQFGPSIEDEVKARMQGNKTKDEKVDKPTCRTTSAERGGKTLMGFLGRRIASGKSV